MTRSDAKPMLRAALTTAALAAACLLAACGQGSQSTHVVLSGPADKVEALIAQHHLSAAPVQAHVEKLPDGGERAVFDKPGGLPAGQLIALGKAAAKAGVDFEFSSGSQWSAGSSSTQGAPPRAASPGDPAAPNKGPVA